MPGASIKEPENPKRPARTFSNLVLPIPGVPLAIESIEEYITRPGEGTSKRDVSMVKTYRDAAGRMRIERNLDSPDGPVPLIQIFDHAEGFMALLDTGSKTAHRLTVPKPEQSAGQPIGHPRFMFSAPLVALSGEKTFKTEGLGTQTIAGVEFEGHRTTTTIEGEPPLIGTHEYWMSMGLGLIGLTSSSDPDSEGSAKIQQVERTEPDPALFVIPGDYSVQDLGTF
jgi:hypothetical protein